LKSNLAGNFSDQQKDKGNIEINLTYMEFYIRLLKNRHESDEQKLIISRL